MTEISFNGGRFVSNQGELNYEEVLNRFPCASIIRILTYNISRNQQDDKLLNGLPGSDPMSTTKKDKAELKDL